jgi:hypothetical protein
VQDATLVGMDHQGAGFPGDRTPARGFPPARQPQAAPEYLFGQVDGDTDPGYTDFGHADPGYADPGYTADPGHVDPGYADPGYTADPGDTVTMPAAERRRGPKGRPGGRKTGRFRIALITVATVASVAAAGFAGYKFLYQPRVNAPVPGTFRLPTNAPGSAGSPAFDKALGKWQHIGTRSQDPAPLTIAELYPPQFVLNGSSYLRTAASTTKTCSLAVFGGDLQAALQSGHCSQVLRASYVSGNGKMMGTIGVANLISASAAQKAGRVTGPQEIIAPLSSRSGATKKLGTGTGVVQAEIKGHYLILMYAEFTSLKPPPDQAASQQLEQFAANLVTGSVNINLSSRMLGGKA